MGALRFGKQETVTCIVDVAATGGEGEPACLAFKTTTYWVGGGVYLSDDGCPRPRREEPRSPDRELWFLYAFFFRVASNSASIERRTAASRQETWCNRI